MVSRPSREIDPNRRKPVAGSVSAAPAGLDLQPDAGAGGTSNICGGWQSAGREEAGHIHEIGIELYQHVPEKAVAASEEWRLQIMPGTPVLIPENYRAAQGVRLGLFHITELSDRRESDAFAELIDRFGLLATEVENLLEIVVRAIPGSA